ncbi:MAG: PHP domain-containing protein, partial [Candidatus Paceibacteria bacterium]
GSVRRKKETIGDVDILVVSNQPQVVLDYFCSLGGIVKIWSKGPSKASVRLKYGLDMDLRVIRAESFGAALQYFTGSKEHNIKTRKIAMDKGFKLNEYGLFKGKKMIAARKEQDIYKALGLTYMEPELREDQGEIEAALQGKLPSLVGYDDIKGDLHCHSDWDGGENSIAQMAEAAQALGYEYIGISDHTKFLKIEKGLDEKKLLQQKKEIYKLNSQFTINPSGSKPQNPGFRILHGCETNILNDGSVDINDQTLAQLDYVIAGVHSNLKMPKASMTSRIIKAMQNPNIDIISHPTGRLLNKREEYQIDFDKVLRAARETKTIMEINASPQRLDLSDQ